MLKATILIGGATDPLPRRTLRRLVQRQGFQVVEATGTADLPATLPAASPHLIIVIAGRKDAGDGLEAAREIRRFDRSTPIILVTPCSSEKIAIGVLRSGITDFLKQPVSPAELAASISRSLACSDSGPEAAAAEAKAAAPIPEGQMVGGSPALLGVKRLSRKVAATDCTVLITGETGTGKELVADLIHRSSPRARNPFVVVNCAAIPDTLLESELFGYEKGAFTGAYSRREGALQMAESGTVFFDEIGDMNPYAQAKVLRIIENKEVCRVGGTRTVRVNVRFIAATNQDLEQLIKTGRFRSDLYFRINVARVHLPPLRERKEDILPLLEYFRKGLNRQLGKGVQGFTKEAVVALMNHDWPGNVRELKNLLEATFIGAGRRIDVRDFPELFRRRLRETKDLSRDERAQVLAALFSSSWNKTKAARQLRWSRMTLYRKMARHRIPPTLEDGSFRSPAYL